MFGMFDIMFNIVTRFYKYSVIKKIIKKSLMGNMFDKTIEYYTGRLCLNQTDEHHTIEYTYNNKDYIIKCDDEDIYKDAILYVKGLCVDDCDSKIIAGIEMDGDKHHNITDLILKYCGPEKDFYFGKSFSVKKEHITDGKLYVIDDNLKYYKIINDIDLCLTNPLKIPE
jgi:hypothetical protein